MPQKQVKHPAKYSNIFIPDFAKLLRDCGRVLDPFAGTGKLALIKEYGFGGEIYCSEIESEWAISSEHNVDHWHIGDSSTLPWEDDFFDAVCTSPCLSPEHRLLTRELTWVPCGDLNEGDKIIAFDESSPGRKSDGAPKRRRWRIAEITMSHPSKKECSNVHLENGDVITCTDDHPWLATRYKDNSGAHEWVKTEDLMSLYDPHVLQQLETWEKDESFGGGWISGIFDGEGSLSFGSHGSPKLMITHSVGVVLDRIKYELAALGIDYRVTLRKKIPNRKQVANVYIIGGFPGILSTLGRLRPVRLINKLDKLDVASRTLQAKKVRVVKVEKIGVSDIQSIETSTGTYIGEGYLMHNTYGNRMADHFNAKDDSRRITYKHYLGRPLNERNSGRMQWGMKYRAIHTDVYHECARVLRDDGLFVLNMSNHIRKGEIVDVTGWHIHCLTELGFGVLEHRKIDTPRMGFGQNGKLRVPYESIIVFRKV